LLSLIRKLEVSFRLSVPRNPVIFFSHWCVVVLSEEKVEIFCWNSQ
jgi:hypothetical protein